MHCLIVHLKRYPLTLISIALTWYLCLVRVPSTPFADFENADKWAHVLMYFGTGSVKGFAVTLFIGVLASMISSVFITRFLLRQAAGLGIKNTKLWAR